MQLSLLHYIAGRVVEKRIEEFTAGAPRILVAWSGGKDSTAALLAAMSCCREKVVAVFIHLVGQTHAANAGAVLRTAKKLGMGIVRAEAMGRTVKLEKMPRPPALIYVISRGRSGKGFWGEAEKRGWPAPVERTRYRGKRWCCQVFKTEPLEALSRLGFRHHVVGVKASDSRYRAQLLAGLDPKLPVKQYRGYTTLYPLFDLSDADVWSLLRRYDEEIYSIIKKQYDVFGYSPNCVLCPLQSRANLLRTLEHMPTQWLQTVRNRLEGLGRRCSDETTWSCRDIRARLAMIDEELRRRTGHGR